MSEETIKGLKELNTFLQQLPAKLERNVLRGALRAGAKQELLPEVQANLLSIGAVKTGELMTGMRVGTRTKGGDVVAYVKAGGKHGHVAHWIEFGTKPHNIKARLKGFLAFANVFVKEVDHPGTQPKPFMRPALDRSGNAAVNEAARYMRERLETKHGLETGHIMLEGDEP